MNEEARIKEAIEERKKRARSVGIVDNVFKLYRQHLRDLREDYDLHSMPKSVTNISYTPSKFMSPETVAVTRDEVVYTFSWGEHDSIAPGSHDKYGTLDLAKDGTLLLQLQCHGEYHDYTGVEWKVYDIGAFLEGPWVEDINKFYRQASSLQGQRMAEAHKNNKRDETEDIKKKFGL
jgi:hypothetical protein